MRIQGNRISNGGFQKTYNQFRGDFSKSLKVNRFHWGNKISIRNNLDPEALGLLKEGLLIYQSELKILRLNLSRFEILRFFA